MPENEQEKAEKKPEKLPVPPAKQRQIRIVTLKTIQLLIIYAEPATLKQIQKTLAKSALYPNHHTLRAIISDIQREPPPGYKLHKLHTRVGHNKEVPAYSLLKIKPNGKTNPI